jgi:hypothetical protein
MDRVKQVPAKSFGNVGVWATAFIVGLLTALGVVLVIGVSSPNPVALWSMLIPSGVCGVVAFGWIFWRHHHGESISDLWKSIRDLWDEIGKT